MLHGGPSHCVDLQANKAGLVIGPALLGSDPLVSDATLQGPPLHIPAMMAD